MKTSWAASSKKNHIEIFRLPKTVGGEKKEKKKILTVIVKL